MNEILKVIGYVIFRTVILLAAAYGTVKYLESLV